MTFNQFDINLKRFSYRVEKDGISITKRRLFSVTKQFIPFENVGSEIIRDKKRNLFWLGISLFFLIITLTVFVLRLKGDRISDTAEMFWLAVSAFFFVIYAFKRKNSVFLVKGDIEDSIEFIGIKIYEERLNQFLKILQQRRDKYLSDKYPDFEGLTMDENIFCVNAEIQLSDGLLLKKLTKHSLEQLMFEDGFSESKQPLGIRSVSTEKNVRKILKEHQDRLINEGKYIFISEFSANEYNIGLIGNTSDPYKIIEYVGTNGANYDIETKEIIERCRQWDQEFGIRLTGIGLDYCECEIKNKNIDYKKLAMEVYKFCPDVVEQGTETIERLENEMKETGRIFLWWD